MITKDELIALGLAAGYNDIIAVARADRYLEIQETFYSWFEPAQQMTVIPAGDWFEEKKMSEEKTGVVSIHGSDYQTVALRVTKFREQHPDWSISTKLMGSGEYVTMKCTIKDENGRVISTGHAQEERGSTNINTSSVVENCETSSVGRALAFFDQPGVFLRSADEMSDALIQQGVKAVEKTFGERMLVIRGMLDQIVDFKDRLADGDLAAAAEIESEWSEEQHEAIKLAPTKGGILTTEEVNKLKTNEYFEARNVVVGFTPKGAA